jgi:3-deoxy-manno-octulosonate cytidylyltransferase (CMP-KDO synthetase)
MIEHVYRRAAEADGVDAVLVATDDERIAAAVRQFGGAVTLTSDSHRTGTDRIAEVARELDCDILVNVQGDLPLVEPGMIAEVVAALTQDAAVRMSTICRAIADAAEYTNPHVVKVVVDRAGDALYFSRAPIPYVRPPDGGRHASNTPGIDVGAAVRRPVATAFKHIGMYGYRRDFLLEFAALPQTPLEVAESLEQLRALEHGVRIRTVETHYESIEVDTVEDLARVRRLMSASALPRNAEAVFR